ncbi:hypothetical protein L842_3101 [Mycobacterium intracellulare MIN_052511_1280]|nr:hypothetical protein L842_3101 [Mycobacterium intracellulare MIN_052511_1280]
MGVDRPLHACHWMFLLSFMRSGSIMGSPCQLVMRVWPAR